jgi:hypothetical protein
MEKFIMVIVFAAMIFGILAAAVNKTWFVNSYVQEDGPIEWPTEIPLFAIFVICFVCLFKYARRKNFWFFIIYLLIGLGSFFVCGEEISWGQRIFNFKTSAYFQEHNSQDEENIHNLVLDGEKLNKIIFTDALIAGVVVYLVIFPLIYNKNKKFKRFIDRSALPLPTLYQIIACVAVFILSFLTFDPKGAELLEFGGSFMFMLIILYPMNKETRRLPN